MRRTTTSPATFFDSRLGRLGLAFLLVSCGKRGDPLPPLRPVPAAAEEVSIRQVGDHLRLAWKAPAANQDGTFENLNLREATVLRRVLDLEALVEAQMRPPAAPSSPTGEDPPAGDEEPEEEPAASPEQAIPEPEPADPAGEPREIEAPVEAPPVPARPPLSIPPFEVEAAPVASLESRVPSAALTYEEPIDPSWIGKRVEYAVLYVNEKNRASPVSAVAQVEPIDPLPAPSAPRAESQDGFVALAWEPPRSDVELAFDLFRRSQEEEEYPEAPVNPEPVKEPSYRDRGAAFGQPICYRIVAVRALSPPEAVPAEPETTPGEELVPIVPPLAAPPRIEGPPSDEVCLTPEDRFPPAAPQGLVAVPSSQGILLTWRSVEARDLGGYRLYHAESPAGPFQLLVEIDSTTHTDATLPPGERRFYAVTAIDQAPGTNESARSEVVEAVGPQ